MLIYCCGGSKNTITIYQEPDHVHITNFDTLKKEVIFDRTLKWLNDNSFKFYKHDIASQVRDSGLIIAKLVKEYDVWKDIKYVGFTLNVYAQDYSAKFVFSDLYGMDPKFNKYSTASDGKSTERVDKIIYDKMMTELEAYIKTYKDY